MSYIIYQRLEYWNTDCNRFWTRSCLGCKHQSMDSFFYNSVFFFNETEKNLVN